MTQFNPLTESGYSNLARRHFGEYVELQTVAPELSPAVILENAPPELALLLRQFLGVADLASTASAGNLSAVGIRNPAGSNFLLILERINVRDGVGTSQQFRFFYIAAQTSDTTGAAISRDRRSLTTELSPALGLTRVQAAQFTSASQVRTVNVATNDTKDFPMAYVLSPGEDFWVQGVVANQGVSASFEFRVRVPLPEALVP